MANETQAPPAHKPVADTGKPKSEKKEETEKEKADKALEEQLKVQGPSGLTVEPPKTAVDTLRDHGFPVVEVAVAPLPGGGPSAQPGMSHGGPPPSPEVIQEGLDEQGKRLEEENKEKEKQLEERKKQEKERLDAQKKATKKAA